MKNEELSEDNQEFYETLKEFIDTLKESPENERQINGILILLKAIIGVIESLEANRDVNFQTQKDSMERSIDIYERIAILEKNVAELALNSSELAKQLVKPTETANCQ